MGRGFKPGHPCYNAVDETEYYLIKRMLNDPSRPGIRGVWHQSNRGRTTVARINRTKNYQEFVRLRDRITKRNIARRAISIVERTREAQAKAETEYDQFLKSKANVLERK